MRCRRRISRTDRLAQGQPRQGVARDRGRRQRLADCRRVLPEGHRHALPVRALSRRARPAMQDLLAGHIDLMFDQAANALPQVRAGNIKAYAVTAKTRSRRRPISRPWTRPGCRLLYLVLARVLGAEGHAEGHRRQAQCRRGRGLGRSGGAAAARGARPGDLRRATSRRPQALARLPQSRDREVVADHQGRQHQGGIRSGERVHARGHADRCGLRGDIRRLTAVAARRANLSVAPHHHGRAVCRRAAPTDTLARILAEHMRASLGQTIIIENVTGAGGTIGVGRVVARGARRLHARHRPMGDPCVIRRDLSAAVRSAEGPGAGRLLAVAPIWIVGPRTHCRRRT